MDNRMLQALFFVVMTIPVLVTLGFAWSAISTVALWDATEGEVVDIVLIDSTTEMRVKRGSSTRTEDVELQTWYPVVAYPLPDGQTHQFRPRAGYVDHPDHLEGATVPVYYDPAAPRSARLGTFSYLWLRPLVVALLTLVFGGVVGGAVFVITTATARIQQATARQEAGPKASPDELRSEAEAFLDVFLAAAMAVDYDTAGPMMTEKARTTLPEDAFIDAFESLGASHGDIVDRSATKRQITSTYGGGEAKIHYTLQHENGTSTAKFNLEKSDDQWVITWFGLEW